MPVASVEQIGPLLHRSKGPFGESADEEAQRQIYPIALRVVKKDRFFGARPKISRGVGLILTRVCAGKVAGLVGAESDIFGLD